MSLTRKAVRDALKAVLSDPTYGVAAKHAALAVDYGISRPFAIDFTPLSRNFFQGYLEPGTVEISALGEYPALFLHTTDATPSQETQFEIVNTRLVVVVKQLFRNSQDDAIELDDTESELDAIEDAIKRTLRRSDIPWQTTHGVIFANEITTSRAPLVLWEDGWEQWLFVDLVFEVEHHD